MIARFWCWIKTRHNPIEVEREVMGDYWHYTRHCRCGHVKIDKFRNISKTDAKDKRQQRGI